MGTSTVYLTQDERTLFDALPAALKKAHAKSVENETIDAYETDNELRTRLQSASFTKDPRALLLAEKIMHKASHNESMDDVTSDEMPEELLSSVLFGMGAVGIAGLVEAMLPDCENDDDFEAVAALTRARHKILVANEAGR
jgi:hypothetical protein